MRMRLFLIVGTLLASASWGALAGENTPSPAGKIYQTTDSEGHPVFSDSAPENAKTITVEQTQTYAGDRNARQYGKFTPIKPRANDNRVPYDVMAITSPSDQTSVRSNPGNVTIAFQLSPGLKKGEKLELLMDGKVVKHVQSAGSVQLHNVDRGTHEVQLQAVDIASGKVLQSSDVVTFTLHRYSILNHKKKNPLI